jgi:hypothetical protein
MVWLAPMLAGQRRLAPLPYGSVATGRTFSAQGRGRVRVRVAVGVVRVKVTVDLNLGVTTGKVDAVSWPYARFKVVLLLVGGVT